jgi:hypothetical protein
MRAKRVNRREFIHASAALGGSAWLAGKGLGEAATEVQVCPKSPPPARTLYALRLSDLTSAAWDTRLTISCLQGLVNRSQPRLYLIHDHYDELWLDWLRERGDVDEVKWLEVGEVFERFLPEVHQGFIIDPAVPATINAATMLAAVRGGLVVTPRTSAQYNLPCGRLPDSWKTGLDFSMMNFKKDVEVYRWVFQQVGDQLSRQVVAVFDPQETALRDYLVEFKIPLLWISGPGDVAKNPKASPEEEKDFARDILMKWPPNIPCLGWPGSGEDPQGGIGEWLGVRLISECAKYMVVCGYDGFGPAVGNLSVHSGTSATLRQPPMPTAKLDRKKVYVCFSASDGDGPNFVRQVYRQLHDDRRRTDFLPIGWHFELADYSLLPDIVDYFYRKRHAGDNFLIALTGLGYIHEDNYADNFPAEDREKILHDYVQLSGQYAARFDVNILTTFAEMSAERLRVFAKMPGIAAILANYARTHETTFSNQVTEVEGVPVFRAVNGTPGDLMNTPFVRRNAESFMVDDIKRWTPAERPAFLFVSLVLWFTRAEMLENIIEGLGPEYVAVRPDQFVSLYRQSRALAPAPRG